MSLTPAEPFYFGPTERSLFGWLHRPAGQQASLGVVICNPFGYEALCAHRTLRHLAERLTSAGFATLRFDYDGTGDSAGDDDDPERLQAWIRSTALAIDTLKERTGVQTVCVAGLRLGAMIATLAGQGRSDVSALLAMAPATRSRAYLRELRALALSRPQAPPPEWARVRDDIQEAAGFFLSAETRQALADIDLAKIEDLRVPRVLILERDDLPSGKDWAESLSRQGTLVAQETFAGYTAMTTSAHESVVPLEMLDKAVSWIGSLDTQRHPARRTPQGWRQTMAEAAFRESIVTPDPHANSFGILTEPSSNDEEPRDAVLLLNAGAISRVGPGRLYVTLARHFASRGIAVLRVDISGIGDSPPRPGQAENAVYAPLAGKDIDAALRFLKWRFGGAKLHAIGLCSGAYHGFKAAAGGAGLASLVAINPLTFFWKEGMSLAEPEFHVAAESARYQSSALRLESWMKLLRGKVNVRAMLRIFALRAQNTVVNLAREVARRLGIPLQDDLAAELRAATRASRRVHFVFSASDPGLTLLLEQGGSMVRRLARKRVLHTTVVPGADHTFTPYWSRIHLVEVLSGHLPARKH